MKSIFQKISGSHKLMLFFAWACMQIFLLYPHGMIITGEAVRVIREAHNLRDNGQFSTGIYFTYLTEILLVYLKLKLNMGYAFILFIHLLANVAAVFYFYKFLTSFYASKLIGLFAALALVVCFPYQQYNSFLYTESIFFSLSVIYSCYLLQLKKFSGAKILKLLLMLFFLCLTRPTGIFFLAATVIYLFGATAGHFKFSSRAIAFIAITIAGLFIINAMIGTGVGINILLPFREAHIICDVPTKIYAGNDPGSNSLKDLVIYISQHPSRFFKLALLKSEAFFGLRRSYYSLAHNLFIGGFFYALYLMIVLAVARFKRSIPPAFLYCFSIIFIFWMAVVFSCDEWHNRFFLTLTPFLLIPAFYFFKTEKKV